MATFAYPKYYDQLMMYKLRSLFGFWLKRFLALLNDVHQTSMLLTRAQRQYCAPFFHNVVGLTQIIWLEERDCWL